ncbi:unnamed protein product [Protopolystoma xenopodis]|uniref:Uncharacterized protein n=1 Tax=Protopolystoma xenopodis TaxID=117903 RepID=A0A3S4ZIE5_9PLAT|nr:unnamed protein product [Protopolystoma xenopodis]
MIYPMDYPVTIDYNRLASKILSMSQQVQCDDLGLDVLAVHRQEDGTFEKYNVSMLGYGFHGDIIVSSDMLRWMGPSRYNWVGILVLLTVGYWFRMSSPQIWTLILARHDDKYHLKREFSPKQAACSV